MRWACYSSWYVGKRHNANRSRSTMQSGKLNWIANNNEMQLNLQNTYIKFLNQGKPPVLVSVINVINGGSPINDDGDELTPVDGIYDKDGNALNGKPITEVKLPLSLNFHTDPGHGWLEVPKKLVPPELKAKISIYSYQDDNNFYLEEDCDAAPIHKHLMGLYDVTVIDRVHSNEAPCRNYRSVSQ